MIHLVTFASDDMSISARRCLDSGKAQGVDALYFTSPSWQSTERGYGYWRWKPEIILATMNGLNEFHKPLNDGDTLIYSDAGVEFIEPVSLIIDRMDQDIWLFGNETYHRQWCKRDIVEAVWPMFRHPDSGLKSNDLLANSITWDRFDRQCQASVIFFRVNDYTRAFVKEWLDWCLFDGGRLIDDSPSRTPNHPEFKENRHDQAILTTLAYREGIKLHHWYVRYPENTPGRGSLYPGDNYPPLYLHHRRRNHEWTQAA